jgi:hypothetical protein
MTFQELSAKAVAEWAAKHGVLRSLSPLSVWYASSPTNIGHSDVRELVIGYGRGGNLSAEEVVPHMINALERLMNSAVALSLKLPAKEDPRHHWDDVLVKVVYVRPNTTAPSESHYFDFHWTVNLIVIPK